MRSVLLFFVVCSIGFAACGGCGDKTSTTVIEQPAQSPEEAAAAAAAYEESMK